MAESALRFTPMIFPLRSVFNEMIRNDQPKWTVTLRESSEKVPALQSQ